MLWADDSHKKDPAAAARDKARDEKVVSEINTLLRRSWEKKGIVPAAKATREEFLRRAFLDIQGHVPSLADQEKFLALEQPQFQQEVCRHLTDAADSNGSFYLRWGRLFSFWFAQTESHSLGDEIRNAHWRNSIRKGKPEDSFMQLIKESRQHTSTFNQDGDGRIQLVGALADSLLGTSLRCAQCHDHPSQPALQGKTFWGLTAAFAAERRSHQDLYRNYFQQKREVPELAYQLMTLETGASKPFKAVPTYLDGTPIQGKEHDALVGAVLDRIAEDPLYSKNMVNRVWGTLFGIPLAEDSGKPNFEFGDDLNPINVKHPELLDQVASAWKADGAKLPVLVNWLCQSEAYALSSREKGVVNPELARDNAALMPVKKLTSHQIGDSLLRPTFQYFNEKGVSAPDVTHFLEGNQRFLPQAIPARGNSETSEQLHLMGQEVDYAYLALAQPEQPGESIQDQVKRAFKYLLGRTPSATELAGGVKLLSEYPGARHPRDIYRHSLGSYFDSSISGLQRTMGETDNEELRTLYAEKVQTLTEMRNAAEKAFIEKWPALSKDDTVTKDFIFHTIIPAVKTASRRENEINESDGRSDAQWVMRQFKAIKDFKTDATDLYWVITNSSPFLFNH